MQKPINYINELNQYFESNGYKVKKLQSGLYEYKKGKRVAFELVGFRRGVLYYVKTFDDLKYRILLGIVKNLYNNGYSFLNAKTK